MTRMTSSSTTMGVLTRVMSALAGYALVAAVIALASSAFLALKSAPAALPSKLSTFSPPTVMYARVPAGAAWLVYGMAFLARIDLIWSQDDLKVFLPMGSNW